MFKLNKKFVYEKDDQRFHGCKLQIAIACFKPLTFPLLKPHVAKIELLVSVKVVIAGVVGQQHYKSLY